MEGRSETAPNRDSPTVLRRFFRHSQVFPDYFFPSKCARVEFAMKKERTDLARFQVGERIRIRTTIMSRRSLQVGRVVSVHLSSRARTLDKYVVRFDDESEEIFWEIQLESVVSSNEVVSSLPQTK